MSLLRRKMIMKLFNIIVPVGMILYSAACAVPQRIPPADVTSSKVKSKEIGGYYYYTESHLMGRRGKLDEAVKFLKEAFVRDEDSVFLKN